MTFNKLLTWQSSLDQRFRRLPIVVATAGFYKEKWHAFRPKLNASLQTLHTIESLKDERTSFKLDGFSFSREQ